MHTEDLGRLQSPWQPSQSGYGGLAEQIGREEQNHFDSRYLEDKRRRWQDNIKVFGQFIHRE
jgi:hypothetical protein